jgi:hypothetical protein
MKRIVNPVLHALTIVNEMIQAADNTRTGAGRI